MSDLLNAATILSTGLVMSRQRAQDERLLNVDTAAPAIIQHARHAHRYARFYFRPCTPTQANAEGIRPPHRVIRDARRPVPIVFVFDAERMLVRDEALYTEGNFSSDSCAHGGDAEFFRQLPFDDIYHDSSLDTQSGRGRQIIFRRCAEILYPDAVDIADLVEIICRTGPERDSLLYRLGEDAKRWEDRIRVVQRGERMFFQNWAFITDVTWIDDEIRLTSNPVYEGPYQVRVKVWTPGEHDPVVDRQETRDRLVAPIVAPVQTEAQRVLVRCYIEGALAYCAVLNRQALF